MRHLIAIVALATLVSTAGCNHDSPTDPGTGPIAGTYTLSQVNRTPMPYSVQNGATTYTITSDVITMTEAGTWSEAYAYTVTTNGQTTPVTDADSGSFTRSGAQVTLTSSAGYVAYIGAFANNALTLSDGTNTFVFTP
jgi:hypothetical protein